MMLTMKYYRLRIQILISFFVAAVIATGCKEREYKTIDGFTQGTTFHIVYSDDAGFALDSITDYLLQKVDFSMSGYNPESILTKVNNSDTAEVDEMFADVFRRSLEMYTISEGLFDVSAAPLFDVWGFGFKNKSTVNQQIIDSVMQFIGMDKVILDGTTIKKRLHGVQLNFNAIAQGYTADIIGRAYDDLGIENYLIEIGGEIYCKGINPKGRSWSVGIDKPIEGNMVQGQEIQAVISLSGGGLATSGNYRKFYEENGEKYSHSINPKTGYPVKDKLLSATVIAADATTADAYGTYFMVAGFDKAREIIEATPGIEGYLIYSEDGGYKVYKSKGVKIKR